MVYLSLSRKDFNMDQQNIYVLLELEHPIQRDNGIIPEYDNEQTDNIICHFATRLCYFDGLCVVSTDSENEENLERC